MRNIIDRNYARARNILTDKMDKLHAMAEALIKYETIDTEQIEDIMSGRPPRPPADWDDDSESTSGGSAVGTEDKKTTGSKGSSIGGPASEH